MFYKKYVKRAFDIILCSFALIVLSPVFLFAAIGIRLSSPGPVFYYSERAGKGKIPFHFYKFRSMHVTNNDKKMFVADAERLFPFGKLIRRLKIDELPQLINVIRGEMSIVGPRPMTAQAVDQLYSGRYEPVSSVRPGLTSAASLFDYIVGDTYTDNGRYIREIVPIKNEMELLYIERQSFGYDAALVLRTMATILRVAFRAKRFPALPELEIVKQRLEEWATSERS